MYIAAERLQFGLTGVNSVRCRGGDFDGDGFFTLNDAAHVAQAIFGVAAMPWEVLEEDV